MRIALAAWITVLIATVFSLTTPPAHGAVLCQKRSGVVVVRSTCKKKETPLDLSQFGAKGDKGDKGDPGPIEGTAAAGDLSGTYPSPAIAAAPAPTPVAANPATATDPCAGPTPQTGIHCGTSARYWRLAGGTSSPLEFWRDRLGQIHLRGSAEVSSGVSGNDPIFYLPVGARPKALATFPVLIGNGGSFNAAVAQLWIQPNGAVAALNASIPSTTEVFFGEITFRTDF